MIELNFCDEKAVKFFSYKHLCKKDKRRVRKNKALINKLDFKLSRVLKYKNIKKKYCISHKKNIAILASSSQKIGIDIEEIKQRNFESISDFCFNELEKTILKKYDFNSIVFYKIFTIKEALIKYLNLGFCDFKNVGLKIENNLLICGNNKKNLLYKTFLLNDNFIISVVFKI